MLEINILKDIPTSHTWSHVEPVLKGWSKDQKFYIETTTGQKLLLRLADISTFTAKEKEYHAMLMASKLNICMSQPLDFGICNNDHVYTLLTWVEGQPIEDILPGLTEETQYVLGKKAGQILKTLHSIQAPLAQEDWEKRMTKKIKTHLDRYRACGIRVENDELALAYVEHNLHRLKDRTQFFQHGDYHVGNLILTPQGDIGVIDFNRWDYGDPYEEFYKMLFFSREISIPFAIGQIHGYFDGEPPEDFFPLIALYIADIILFSIVWAMPYGADEVQGMVRRAQMILEDFQGFSVCTPVWYQAVSVIN